MPRLLRIAMQTSLGRGGVSVLTIPGDLSAQPAANATKLSDLVTSPPAASLHRRSRNGLQTCSITRTPSPSSQALASATHEVLTLAATLNAPIGHSLGGKEWIQYDNPYDVGMSGLLGYGACYEATHSADLLFLLGTDFPYDSFLPQAHAVQIDRDPSHLCRRSILDLGIAGDVGQTLRAVLPLLRRKTRRTFLDRMLKQHAEALERVVAADTRNIEHMRPIHPEYVAAQLDSLAAEDAIFTVDTGMCNVWGARYLTPNGRRRVLGSLRHGSMANALPHAVGAQLAAPESPSRLHVRRRRLIYADG
jgi:pyruvate dehydrogenase (quinone)